MITITVNGEKAKVTVGGTKKLLKGSVGQYRCEVTFDEGWQDYDRHIIFRNEETWRSYKMSGLHGIIGIPSEILEEQGCLYISAVGIFGENRRFTNVCGPIPIVARSSVEDIDKSYGTMIKMGDYLWLGGHGYHAFLTVERRQTRL